MIVSFLLIVLVLVGAVGLTALYYKETDQNEGDLTLSQKIDMSIKQVLKNEGGYINNPADSGGETNWGISAKYHPNEDIKNMTKERATEIYYNEYVLPMYNYLVDEDLNGVYQIIDSSINCGVSRTKELLKKVTFNYPFKQVRIDYYNSIAKGKNAQFLNGWLRRVNVKL